MLILLLSLAGYKAYRVWQLTHSLEQRLDDLQTVAEGDADQGLRDTGENLRGAHADLTALKSEIGLVLPFTQWLGWVPAVGGDLRAVPALLDVALSVTEAGKIAFEGLEPLVVVVEGDGDARQTLAQVLDALSNARPALESAQASLAVAQARRSDIDDDALSARTAGLVDQLDRYLPLMPAALDGGRVLPDLLGASGQRQFLILAQNNDELRGTGGLISAAGLLTLDGGEIVEIGFEDSYLVDDFTHPYPDSPPQILRYMGIDQWVFRDANWSPDFPTSAQKAIELYRISRDLEVDGVLTVDQHALKAIVSALEPLEAAGWPEPVTGENVISLIRMAWASTEDPASEDANWWMGRKRFIGDLFSALQAKVETAPKEVNWVALSQAILGTLDERHFQVWLTDPVSPVADMLAQQGWDGAIRQTGGDYLMVVDTNMGFNKANAIVQESLDYRVLVSVDQTAMATLTVHHAHLGSTEEGDCDIWAPYVPDYDELINRCYWNYLRVYVPDGSELAAATAHPISGDLLVTGQKQAGVAEVLPEENGKTVFGSFFVLPKGEEIETRFAYQVPQTVLERTNGGWRYRLLVQKQAGTGAIPLRVELTLPPGSQVEKIVPMQQAGDGPTVTQLEPNIVIFETSLDRDRIFEVTFRSNEPD
jgi:hypothetical protein